MSYSKKMGPSTSPSPIDHLNIAICVPDLDPMQNVMSGKPADATYIIQGYIAAGLRARDHSLTFVAPRNIHQMVCSADLQSPTNAPQTWSASRWFENASKATWRVQQLLGIPYLNVFSNYRRYDSCLRCLPGHDIVYERNGLYRAGVAMACRRLKTPYVLFVEADEIMEHDYMGKPITGMQRSQAGRMFRYNLKVADCVICVSKPLKDHLVTSWNVPGEKIVVFPNGVDVQKFQPYPETRTEIRASLGLNGNPMVVFVGSFYEWHDLSTLLDAFAEVISTYPDTRLVLVGDGSQRQSMIQRAADHGISDKVTFTGFVPHTDIPHYMSAADIAVAPYPAMNRELWLSPLKLYEYMASGSAVVASALGQPMELIEDGKNGLLVAPGDASDMADALKKLIADSALRSSLGAQARNDMVRRYSWDQYVSRLERLFAAVISGKPFNLI